MSVVFRKTFCVSCCWLINVHLFIVRAVMSYLSPASKRPRLDLGNLNDKPQVVTYFSSIACLFHISCMYEESQFRVYASLQQLILVHDE